MFGDLCIKCDLTRNDNGQESLKCINCVDGYYLSSEGICLSFDNLLSKIPNCASTIYFLGEISYYINFEQWEDHIEPYYYFYPSLSIIN